MAASWCIIPSCSRYLWLMYICLETAVISISLLCYFLQTFRVLSGVYKTGPTLASWMPFFLFEVPPFGYKILFSSLTCCHSQLSFCKNAKVHYIWNTLRITLRVNNKQLSPNKCTHFYLNIMQWQCLLFLKVAGSKITAMTAPTER